MPLEPMLRVLALRLALLALAGSAQAAGQAVVLNPDLAGVHVPPDGPTLAWGSDATVWYHDAATQRWQAAQTPHHARIRALSRSADTLVAVGDEGLLLHSTDGGRQWQADAAAGLRGLVDVDCHGRLCLALATDGQLLRSDDGGRQWQGANTAADPAGPAGALTRVRADASGRWWVGNAQGQLWRGSNDAHSWQAWRLSRHGIDTLAVDGQQLLVATADGRLLGLQPDGGAARLLHLATRGSFINLQALPQPGAWVATGTQGACAWRAGSTATWQPCHTPSRRLLRGVASSPDSRHWVVVGEAGLLMNSRDQGRRWQAVAVSGQDEPRHLEAVAWSPAHRGFIAVGVGGVVLRSDPEGRRWTVQHSAPRHYVHDLVQTGDGSLLASLSYRTLARSDDGGRNWRSHRFDSLKEPAFLFALHADPQRGSLLAAGGQGSVMVAPDGRHWRHESLGHGRDYLGLLAHPDQPLVLLYGSGGTVLRVDTAQARWQSVALPASDPVYAGLHSAGDNHWLLGAAGLVLHSGDAGRNWQVQRLGRQTLRTGLSIEQGRVLLAAGDGGTLWRTRLPETDTTVDHTASPQGQTWLRIATSEADWRWLLPDGSGRALWLGGSGGRLDRSFDGGLSWTPQALPTTSTMRRPVHDAQRRRWWMPGRDGTLLHSGDDGASWQRVETHTREHLKGLWIDPASGDVLLYGARLVRVAIGTAP